MQQFHHQTHLDSGYFFNATIIHHEKSLFQDIKIIENKDYGRALLLDDKIMLSTEDEHEYHELIVHPSCLQLHNFDNALIIGGGDCFTAKTLLNYSFSYIDMIEIDKSVVDICCQYFKDYLPDIKNESRLSIYYEDAFKFKTDKLYNYIALDLTDPDVNLSQSLYSTESLEDIKKKMAFKSILSIQAASPFEHAGTFQNTVKTLSKLFKYIGVYGKYMTMYGTYQYFIYCSDEYNVQEPDYLHIYNNIRDMNLGKLKIYTPEYHQLLLNEYRIHTQYKSNELVRKMKDKHL